MKFLFAAIASGLICLGIHMYIVKNPVLADVEANFMRIVDQEIDLSKTGDEQVFNYYHPSVRYPLVYEPFIFVFSRTQENASYDFRIQWKLFREGVVVSEGVSNPKSYYHLKTHDPLSYPLSSKPYTVGRFDSQRYTLMLSVLQANIRSERFQAKILVKIADISSYLNLRLKYSLANTFRWISGISGILFLLGSMRGKILRYIKMSGPKDA